MGGLGFKSPLPCCPDLPAVGTEYDLESVERDYETGIFPSWIGIVLRWHPVFLADVESFIFVSWALLWVHQLHRCWDPWLQLLWLRQRCVFKVLLANQPPQQAPGFPVAKSPTNSCWWSPSAFSRCPLGKDIRWLRTSFLTHVVYIWLMRKSIPPWILSPGLMWMRLVQPPLREHKLGLTAPPSSLS